MIRPKHYLKKEKIQKLAGLIIILVITIIGVKLIVSSHAQSPYVSTQADSGSITPPAAVQNCTGSVDGKCVQFGTASTLAIHVSGTRLVNGQNTTIRLLGVNSEGTEKGCVQGIGFTNGAPLTQASADAISSWKINAVRIPLNEDCWLGINGVSINGMSASASAQAYQTAIQQWIAYLNKNGIIAILDLHFSAPGANLSTSTFPAPDEDHAPAFWTKVATTFKSNPAVIFDLFNEPRIGTSGATVTPSSESYWSCWLSGCTVTNSNVSPAATYTSAGMQQLVDTVRATGAAQPIMVGGLHWAGDPCGQNNKYGSSASCTEVANMPTDSMHQLIISYHSYYNTTCGLSSAPTYQSCWDGFWNYQLTQVSAANYPIVSGEFGEDDCAISYMNDYMSWADQNNQSYLAWQWGIPGTGATACSTTNNGMVNYYVNWDLLSNYNGTPGTLNPQGLNYQAHLSQVSPY